MLHKDSPCNRGLLDGLLADASVSADSGAMDAGKNTAVGETLRLTAKCPSEPEWIVF